MTVPPSNWDDWFLDLVFAGICTVGILAFTLTVFLARTLIKREMDRLNNTLAGIQVTMKDFTAAIQIKLDSLEHRVSMLEGFYYRDGFYIGPDRRKKDETKVAKDSSVQ